MNIKKKIDGFLINIFNSNIFILMYIILLCAFVIVIKCWGLLNSIMPVYFIFISVLAFYLFLISNFSASTYI